MTEIDTTPVVVRRMRRGIAAAMLVTGLGVAIASPAAALNPQPEPPGAQVVAIVRTLFPVLPPNPCVRVPNLNFGDNPVLPPNPCFGGRTRT